MSKTYIIDGKEEESASPESIEAFNTLCAGVDPHAEPRDHIPDVGCTTEELDDLIGQASRMIVEGVRAGNGPDEEDDADVATGVVVADELGII